MSRDVKATLAKQLSDTMLTIEIGTVTESAKVIDWMWFQVVPADDWAVGGVLGDKYVRGRLMCRANIITPEALLNQDLKLRAISEVTRILRDNLATDPNDDGSGVWVMVQEVPQGTWGSAGAPTSVSELIDVMQGDVSSGRRAEMRARFEGFRRMREQFGIPATGD